MNDQIYKLYARAFQVFDKRDENYYEMMAKFTELIVEECVQVAGPDDSYTDEWFKAKADSVAKIKQHFGIQ
jgi:hypothetical protein